MQGSPTPPEAADVTEARLRVEVTTWDSSWFAAIFFFVLLKLINVDNAVAGQVKW